MSSDLFKNIERSIFTFNVGAISEICFHKVIPGKDVLKSKTTESQIVEYDNCIDKYMLAFEEVKLTILHKLSSVTEK